MTVTHPVQLEGEVVAIFERDGQRVAKIRLGPHAVVSLAALGLADVHLGDRVFIGCAPSALDAVEPSGRPHTDMHPLEHFARATRTKEAS